MTAATSVTATYLTRPAGDSSGREYPCTEQNRHRPIDISELPDGFGHTVVEGGCGSYRTA